jgi:hypothetical protein
MSGALLTLMGCEDVSVNVIDVAVVELSPEDLTVFEGQEKAVSVVLRSSHGEVLGGRAVEWSIDDPGVAVVSASGIVRGQEPGTTTVRAVSEGVEGTGRVTVVPRPTIALSRSEVEFRATVGEPDPPDQEVEVVNEEVGELSGLDVSVETEGSADSDWLAAALSADVAPATLTVAVSAGDLSPGRYQGTVLVSAPGARNSPQELRVSLEVEEPPPEIDLVPEAISMGSTAFSREPVTRTVRVENVGGGRLDGLSTTIHYEDGPTGWLSAELESTSAPTVLAIQASARRLWIGTYRAEVEVSSPVAPGGSRRVEVVFEVGLPWGDGQAAAGAR